MVCVLSGNHSVVDFADELLEMRDWKRFLIVVMWLQPKPAARRRVRMHEGPNADRADAVDDAVSQVVKGFMPGISESSAGRFCMTAFHLVG